MGERAASPFCCKAGPCGNGPHRQPAGRGQACDAAAAPFIPVKPGDRVKTDRRDAAMPAGLHRAGALTAVRVPHTEARVDHRTGQSADLLPSGSL